MYNGNEGAVDVRGLYVVFLIILILFAYIPPKDLPVSDEDNLIIQRPIERFMGETSLMKVEYSFDSAPQNRTVGLFSTPGQCSLNIYCRPTGALIPSIHCYIITSDNRHEELVAVKFTAGPDPRKRSRIASWQVKLNGTLAEDELCLQCSRNNDIPCFKIDCLRRLTKEFNNSRFQYDFRAKKGPNSNSFVTGILQKCGLSYSIVDFPVGASGYEYVFN
jgi:hypothetical protein